MQPKTPKLPERSLSAISAGIPWTLPGVDGQPIIGNTHLPASDPAGVLVLCHGFKGYKDYGFFPYLARRAAQAGLIAHRFNFSHSGMTDHIEKFERPDLFERDTWGKQMHDLRAVAAAIAEGTLAGRGLPVTWFGHSRGGVTVILTAANLQQADDALRPARVIAAAAPDEACHFSPETRELMRRQGYLDSPSTRTGQMLRVGVAWLDEIEADPEKFDLLAATKRLSCPVMVVHGTQDTTVPAACAKTLAAAARQGRLELIPGASHTFDCPNPPPEDGRMPAATVRLADDVMAFAARE